MRIKERSLLLLLLLLTTLVRSRFPLVLESNLGLQLMSFVVDWSRKLAPVSQPIRCKTKTNQMQN